MDKIILESNYQKQFLISFLLLGVGLILIFLCKNFSFSEINEIFSGFILGVLISIISFFSLIFVGKRKIIIDKKNKNITFITQNRFKEDITNIKFNDISDMSIIELGDNEGGSIHYDIEIKLKKAKSINLFSGYFFDGMYSKLEIEALKDRLKKGLI
ncbi:MAG: hypothetical protein U0457_14710 [Candidatus Sericytochromatia bacterium]